MSTILLPLDGSALAEQAIPQAQAQLRDGDCLVLVRVAEPYLELAWPSEPALGQPLLRASEADVAAYLSERARPLRGHGYEVEEKVLLGVPRDQIPAAAQQVGADLIVMTSHGYSGGKRWLLGSVAEAVAREAPCPVWLVRGEAQPPAPGQRVLVALDSSPHAERGLEFAVDWLRVRPAELLLYGASGLAKPGEGWSPEPESRRELLASTRTYLERQAARLRERGWHVRTVAEDGPAASGILQAAQREGVDLIVMGSHGRTGLARWFWGSVAERVFRHASCPVLLVNSRVRVPVN